MIRDYSIRHRIEKYHLKTVPIEKKLYSNAKMHLSFTFSVLKLESYKIFIPCESIPKGFE